MRIYKKQNVFNAALERIRILYDEFDEIIVGYSGGKDSTICLELCMIVAKEKNRLPLKVMFIDQETEWQATIDLVEEVMTREDIEPLWYQMPIVISNNASSYERFTKCWDIETPEKWMHPKHELSIKENVYGTDRFHDLFGAIMKHDYSGKKVCYIAGVRTEESPKRYVALTYAPTYKWITWAKRLNKNEEHYTFYPIYDWNYTDVWKAIHEHNWKYNNVYNELYRHGYSVRDMRVSNLHHETALSTLLKVQEIEPETWVKITDNVNGANTAKHLQTDSFSCPKELPSMFESWEEYAHHLIKYLVQEESNKKAIYSKIESSLPIYEQQPIRDHFFRAIITTVLSSDWDFTKLANWSINQDVYGYRKFMQGRRDKKMLLDTKFFNAEQLNELINLFKTEENEDKLEGTN